MGFNKQAMPKTWGSLATGLSLSVIIPHRLDMSSTYKLRNVSMHSSIGTSFAPPLPPSGYAEETTTTLLTRLVNHLNSVWRPVYASDDIVGLHQNNSKIGVRADLEVSRSSWELGRTIVLVGKTLMKERNKQTRCERLNCERWKHKKQADIPCHDKPPHHDSSQSSTRSAQLTTLHWMPHQLSGNRHRLVTSPWRKRDVFQWSEHQDRLWGREQQQGKKSNKSDFVLTRIYKWHHSRIKVYERHSTYCLGKV